MRDFGLPTWHETDRQKNDSRHDMGSSAQSINADVVCAEVIATDLASDCH